MKLHSLTEAVMGAAEYKMPENVQQIMADFYLVELLDHGSRRTQSHRSDLIDHEIEHVESVLLPGIKKHMLSYVAYSLAREMRHLFDAARIKRLPARSPIWLTMVSDKYEIITKHISEDLASTILSTIDMKEAMKEHIKYYGGEISSQDSTQALMDAKRLSNGVGVVSRAETDPEALGIASAALEIFDPGLVEWDPEFGGKLWRDAAVLWFKLYKAKSARDIKHSVDLIYQQQHNSGALLNKSEEYEGHWLSMMLNLKYEANEPDQLMPMASLYMRKLASMVLADKKGRSYDRKQGEPVASIQHKMAGLADRILDGIEGVTKKWTSGDSIVFNYISMSGNRYKVQVTPKGLSRDDGGPLNYYQLDATPDDRNKASNVHKRVLSAEDLATVLMLIY